MPVVIENMPGASGQIGLTALARATPDGSTIAGGQGGNLVVAPHTYKKLPYDPLKDFAPIALSTTNYLGIVANIDAPFKTLPEMIAYAKANPGKLTVATNGEGGFPHLAMEDMRIRGSFTYTHVPYKGSAQIVGDLIGGQVMAGIDGITGLTPQIARRQNTPARGHQSDQSGAVAGHAGSGRGGAGLRLRRLVRLYCPGGHAARSRGQAQ